MEEKIPTTAGNLKVSEDVVSTIAKQVIEDTDGVYSLSQPPVSMKDVLIKSGVQRPVKITLNGDVAIIDVSVILKMGYQVVAVAEKIQNAVKEEVQNMTGVAVSAVNITVVDVMAEKRN